MSGSTALRRHDRPNIMFLTGHLPYPPVSGGRRREFELLTRLCDRFAFHVVVISKTPDEDLANADAFRRYCESLEVAPAVHPGGSAPPHLPSIALRHWAPGGADFVRQRLEEGGVTVLHIEGFYLMHHAPAGSPVPVLLVEQNVEYTIWHQRMRRARGRRQRRRNLAEYARTLQAEIEAWKRSDLCAAVTDEDRATMLAAVPSLDVRLIPDGADHAPTLQHSVGSTSTEVLRDGPTVAFVANFGYAPNVDAALYLTKRIMPAVAARVPSAKLFLVGNAPPPEIRTLQSDGIVVTGRVPSIEPYLEAADVVVCPLREGGGVKVKVLEALRHGKAVVTTPVGAQGLDSKGTGALLVRDDPRSFARAVEMLLVDETERTRLETAARRFAETLPTWDEAAESLARCYEELITSQARASSPA